LKLIKILLFIFVITGIFSLTGVMAITRGYIDIKIPSFSGLYTDGDYQKTITGYQYLETNDARDSLNWYDERAVEARTRHTVDPISSTSWKDVIIDGTINWGNQNSAFGVYRLELRAKLFTPTKVRYWGFWTY